MNDFLQSLRNGQVEKPRTPKTRKNSDNSYHYTSSPRFHSYGGYQNNRNQGMKKNPAQQQPGNQIPVDDISTTSLLAEAIENLSIHVESLTKNQEYLISIQERTADMIERQAIAIEKIVDYLNISPNISPTEESKPEIKVALKVAPEERVEIDTTEPIEDVKQVKPIENVKQVKPIVKTLEPKKSVVRRRKKIVTKNKPETTEASNKLLSREAVMDIIQSMRTNGDTFDQIASRLIDLGQPTFSGRGEWHAQTIHRLCNKK